METYRMNGRLEGQAILIVGGSSGIGLATAKRVIEEGGSVHIAARTTESLVKAKSLLSGDVQTYRCDASVEPDVIALFDSLPAIDHVFVTAGTFAPDDVRTTPLEELRAIHDSRLWSCVHIARHAATKIAPHGSITFMSGTAAWYPEGAALTSAACGGVQSLARSLAVSMTPVRFNSLCPGYTRTPLWQKSFGEQGDAILESLASRVPLGRVAEAEEIADAALFLMANNFVNGIELVVDGGSRLI